MVGAPKYSRRLSWAGDILQAIHKGIQHYYSPNYDLPKQRRVLVLLSHCQGIQEKQRMTETPIMRLLNFSKVFELMCDASGISIGEVLS